jgi:hypothetical protein
MRYENIGRGTEPFVRARMAVFRGGGLRVQTPPPRNFGKKFFFMKQISMEHFICLDPRAFGAISPPPRIFFLATALRARFTHLTCGIVVCFTLLFFSRS